MTFALIALLGLAISNLDARRYSNCNSCATKSCGSCVKQADDCAEIPQCFVWQKVPACAQKHVYYTCPEDTNVGPCDCTAEERIHGGAASKNY